MKHICLAASDLGYVRKHFGTELWNHVQELTVDDLGYTEPRFPAEITRILPLLTNLKHLKIGLAYHIIDFPDATSGVDLETEVEDFVQNVLSYPDVKPFMSLRGLESLTLEELQPNCCRKYIGFGPPCSRSGDCVDLGRRRQKFKAAQEAMLQVVGKHAETVAVE